MIRLFSKGSTETMARLKKVAAQSLLLMVFSVTSLLASEKSDLAATLNPIFGKFDHADSPGMSVAVIKNGVLIFSRSYGSAQLEYQVPVTSETTFHVASVSKQFTAMAIMLLEADGLLSLDEPIQKYIPWVPTFKHPISVRQLVNHTSGIRDQWELLYMAGWRLDDVITMDDIRTMMKRQTELNFAPQNEILYSNMGYTLMADIVAEVSSQSFPEFTRKRIFEPLGMNHSHFHMDHQEIDPGRAYSYELDDNGQLKKSVLSFANAGATSLFSTAEDLVLWLDNFRSHTLGNERLIANMLEVPKLSNGEPASLFGAGYAGGLMLGEYRGLKTIGHGGSDAGFRANIQWFPDQNVGIAVLTNLASGDPAGHLHKVADVVLESHFPESPPARVQPGTYVEVDRALLESYAGMFQIEGAGLMNIIFDEGELKADISGMGTFMLNPLSETDFLIEELEARIIFNVDAQGQFKLIRVETSATEYSGTRLVPVVLSSEIMSAYQGSYYSPELRAQWDLVGTDGKLLFRLFRHGDVALLPSPATEEGRNPVEFSSEQWFVSKLIFEVDEAGTVSGFRVSAGRVKNLWFRKLESDR